MQYSLMAFQCTDLGDDANPDWYFVGDLSLKCYSQGHMRLATYFAIPSLVFWGLGIPLIAFLLLRLRRFELHTTETQSRYGFLYEGYNLKYYFWEFVIIYRKILLICASVFLGRNGVRFQALCVLFIGGLNYLFQKWFEPYEDEILNEMEKRSLIVSTITVYIGLYYLTNLLSVPVKLCLLLVVFIALAYFYLYFLKEFIIAKGKSLLSVKFIDKYFGHVLRRFLAWAKPKKRRASSQTVEKIEVKKILPE
eukprot:TRINITY_DN4761_c0_g1_i4.p1 TRINITY_DN4761_c0_g1~~TRINITY_DN4761_c0_g1_i4.p1  ORF type:complete len:251 (+),score=34.12 TRINITY_DN4761_c0_g1_i4:87-839(+)